MALLDCNLSAASSAAEYQPGYDGLPVGGKELPPNTRPGESPRRMAKPFEWATRRSRVGTGDGTPLPRWRQSDEKKVPSPFPGKPLKTRPKSGSLSLRGNEIHSHEKTQKCTKIHSGASHFCGNAHSSPPPRPFQLLGVLGELGVGRFHAKGAKPAKGSLGRSPFCGFSWQFQVARHRLRV